MSTALQVPGQEDRGQVQQDHPEEAVYVAHASPAPLPRQVSYEWFNIVLDIGLNTRNGTRLFILDFKGCSGSAIFCTCYRIQYRYLAVYRIFCGIQYSAEPDILPDFLYQIIGARFYNKIKNHLGFFPHEYFVTL